VPITSKKKFKSKEDAKAVMDGAMDIAPGGMLLGSGARALGGGVRSLGKAAKKLLTGSKKAPTVVEKAMAVAKQKKAARGGGALSLDKGGRRYSKTTTVKRQIPGHSSAGRGSPPQSMKGDPKAPKAGAKAASAARKEVRSGTPEKDVVRAVKGAGAASAKAASAARRQVRVGYPDKNEFEPARDILRSRSRNNR
jgi:hypothetical protein